MSEAAPQAASGNADGEHRPEAVSHALGALRLAWGDIYRFGHDEDGYWAARHDRPGTGVHRADDPEELSRLLADYSGPGPS